MVKQQEGHDGPYGFGTVRTLRDYEKYSGFYLKNVRYNNILWIRTIHQTHIILNLKKSGRKTLLKYSNIVLILDSLKYLKKIMIFGWLLSTDENDETLYRKDADKAEINRMLNDPDGYCKVWREFQTEHKPKVLGCLATLYL
jgi:hypothetical protein